MSHTPYRRDIDGLRGLAILAVLLFHAFPTLLSGGYVGVDVFFVISGYLITGIILRGLEAGNFTIRDFYARRVRRIFPALVVVLACVWASGWLILFPDEYRELGKHIGASSLFISNVTLWHEAGYFDRSAEMKPLLHLWSLGVEEQFYIVLPSLLIFLHRRRRALALLLGLFGLSLLLNLCLVYAAPSASFYLLPMRFWQLLLGGLLAYTQQHRPCARAEDTPYLSTVGLALLVVAFFSFTSDSIYPSWRALLPTLGAALLIATPKSLLNRQVLASKPLVGLGVISYPLYLWHWPLLAYARILHAGEPSALTRMAAVGLAVAFAWATYRWVECPLRFGHYRHHPRVIRALLIAMVLMGSVGALTWHFKGLPTLRPFDAALMKDTEKLDDLRAAQQPCAYAFGDSLHWCLVAGKSPPSIAIFGDSHADHLLAGVVKDTRHGWLLIGQSSCPPAAGLAITYLEKPDECVERNAQILDALIASPAIKTVVLAARGMAYISDVPSLPHATGRNNPANWHSTSSYAEDAGLAKPELLLRGMSRTITRLEQGGKKVVLFMDVPELDFLAIRCVPRPLPLLAPDRATACSMPKAEALARAAPYRDIMETLARQHPNVRMYDPTPQLCDATRCYAGTAQMLYYRDNNHLSQRGSEKVMGDFIQWLEE